MSDALSGSRFLCELSDPLFFLRFLVLFVARSFDCMCVCCLGDAMPASVLCCVACAAHGLRTVPTYLHRLSDK